MRGIICNNENDFRNKERLIHNHLKKFTGYTSNFYAGGLNRPDVFTIDGKPVLLEPKNEIWAAEMPKLPLNFTDLNESIIKNDL